MMAARIQFSPLFYLFKHTKYQVLHLRDLFERAQMPDEIRSYVESHESFSSSGLQNRGQESDFVQAESNKLIKSFLYLPKKFRHVYVGKLKLQKNWKHRCAR